MSGLYFRRAQARPNRWAGKPLGRV